MVGSWIPDLGGAGLGSGCGRIDDLIEANAHCKCSKSWSKMVDSWILKLGGGGLVGELVPLNVLNGRSASREHSVSKQVCC